MKTLWKVNDWYGNEYMVVSKAKFIYLELSDTHKNDYFGYVNENYKFISCEKHKDKNPSVVFVICDNEKIEK